MGKGVINHASSYLNFSKFFIVTSVSASGERERGVKVGKKKKWL